jgi:hypothetical protein
MARKTGKRKGKTLNILRAVSPRQSKPTGWYGGQARHFTTGVITRNNQGKRTQ